MPKLSQQQLGSMPAVPRNSCGVTWSSWPEEAIQAIAMPTTPVTRFHTKQESFIKTTTVRSVTKRQCIQICTYTHAFMNACVYHIHDIHHIHYTLYMRYKTHIYIPATNIHSCLHIYIYIRGRGSNSKKTKSQGLLYMITVSASCWGRERGLSMDMALSWGPRFCD